MFHLTGKTTKSKNTVTTCAFFILNNVKQVTLSLLHKANQSVTPHCFSWSKAKTQDASGVEEAYRMIIHTIIYTKLVDWFKNRKHCNRGYFSFLKRDLVVKILNTVIQYNKLDQWVFGKSFHDFWYTDQF